MRELNSAGEGKIKKQAQPTTPEMEATLWDSRETSKGLLNVVFWYSCKLFGLRAADEHKDLKVSQMQDITT